MNNKCKNSIESIPKTIYKCDIGRAWTGKKYTRLHIYNLLSEKGVFQLSDIISDEAMEKYNIRDRKAILKIFISLRKDKLIVVA